VPPLRLHSASRVHLSARTPLCKGGEVDDEEHDFDAIWHDISPGLWQAILAYSGGRREVADEAVAEAFARAIQRDAQVRNSKAYLYRIAFRIASAELRRDRDAGTDVEEAFEDEPPLADLGPALRRLSPSQRAAVFLHYEADLPVREVARLMGTSAAAVRVHLMRGRRRLADLLGENDDDD
jgi:RNA polymerase sigma factor (sigma-70 family)